MSGHASSAERASAHVAAELVQLIGREDAAASGLPSRDALQLAELLERIDADVRVRADAERYRALSDALGGQKAVAEVGLRRRAGADGRTRRGEEVELGAVRVRRMHDRRSLAQAARAREELDRPAPVLREALLDLLRLLVGVDVERQLLGGAVPADLLEPLGRARADGVGGEPDADACVAKAFDLLR